MANINLSEAYAVAQFGPFGGINGQPKDRKGCILSDIINFRITESGTLEKRDGYSQLMLLPGVPRAVLAVAEDEMLVLVGGQIYRSSIIAKTSIPVSAVAGSEGNASFFRYEGDIYLLDGVDLYRFDGNGFSPAEGYAPLYFKDGVTDRSNPVHEPLNLLSSRYRVSYKIGDTIPSTIPLPFTASSVDGALVNGADDVADRYSIGSGGSYVTVPSGVLQPKDVLELTVTMVSHPLSRGSVAGCTRAAVFGVGRYGHAESSVAFYGSPDGRSVFTSHPVDSEEYLKVKRVCGDAHL